MFSLASKIHQKMSHPEEEKKANDLHSMMNEAKVRIQPIIRSSFRTRRTNSDGCARWDLLEVGTRSNLDATRRCGTGITLPPDSLCDFREACWRYSAEFLCLALVESYSRSGPTP